jgi:hypothetical protein
MTLLVKYLRDDKEYVGNFRPYVSWNGYHLYRVRAKTEYTFATDWFEMNGGPAEQSLSLNGTITVYTPKNYPTSTNFTTSALLENKTITLPNGGGTATGTWSVVTTPANTRVWTYTGTTQAAVRALLNAFVFTTNDILDKSFYMAVRIGKAIGETTSATTQFFRMMFADDRLLYQFSFDSDLIATSGATPRPITMVASPFTTGQSLVGRGTTPVGSIITSPYVGGIALAGQNNLELGGAWASGGVASAWKHDLSYHGMFPTTTGLSKYDNLGNYTNTRDPDAYGSSYSMPTDIVGDYASVPKVWNAEFYGDATTPNQGLKLGYSTGNLTASGYGSGTYTYHHWKRTDIEGDWRVLSNDWTISFQLRDADTTTGNKLVPGCIPLFFGHNPVATNDDQGFYIKVVAGVAPNPSYPRYQLYYNGTMVTSDSVGGGIGAGWATVFIIQKKNDTINFWYGASVATKRATMTVTDLPDVYNDYKRLYLGNDDIFSSTVQANYYMRNLQVYRAAVYDHTANTITTSVEGFPLWTSTDGYSNLHPK